MSTRQPLVPDRLLSDVRSIIADARASAIRSVDSARVMMYWQLGKYIVEEKQGGKQRVDYGSRLLCNLAKVMEPEYGSGFFYRQLAFCRQFYLAYPIVNALRSQFNWMQYRLLIQIPDTEKREYYELKTQLVRERKRIEQLLDNATHSGASIP